VTTLPVLETSRLILRAHTVADFEDVAGLWGDERITRFIGGKPSTREETWARLLRYAGNWSLLGWGFWCAREKESGAYVGDMGFISALRGLPEPFGDYPEVGWSLTHAMHGKGYATEAVRAALAWGDVHLPGVKTVCIIDPDNGPSRAVAERCGFTEFGRGTYHDDELIMLQRVKGQP
jgi:RimJ/RimL family protein N-acetyltransferase